MPAVQLRVGDVRVRVTYTAMPTLEVGDVRVRVTYSGLVALLDYVALQVAAAVGHTRVYNRQRNARRRLDFEALFTDSSGLEFWTVRRGVFRGSRVASADSTERVHTVMIEGLVAHKDADADADATEYQMQQNAEAICDRLRPLVTMGGLVETSWVGRTTVDETTFAGVACHRARVALQAQVFATG